MVTLFFIEIVRYFCERSAGCSSCQIIVKFSMKVDCGKTTPIVFGVGGAIVSMVTIYTEVWK